MNDVRRKRGRPPSATSLTSAQVNYEALAWEVKQRIIKAAAEGQKIQKYQTVRQIIRESIKQNPGIISSADQREKLFKTAYTNVRKILKKWGEKVRAPTESGEVQD